MGNNEIVEAGQVKFEIIEAAIERCLKLNRSELESMYTRYQFAKHHHLGKKEFDYFTMRISVGFRKLEKLGCGADRSMDFPFRIIILSLL